MRISSSSLFLVTYHSAAVQKSHERTLCCSAVDIFLFLSAGDGFACGDIVPSRSRHNRRGNTLSSSNTNHSVFPTRTTQANKISPWPRRQRMELAEYRLCAMDMAASSNGDKTMNAAYVSQIAVIEYCPGPSYIAWAMFDRIRIVLP